MRLVIKAAIASLAVLSAAPALAQPPRPPGAIAPGGWDLNRRIDWMQQRIDRGRSDGSLDRREAMRVQRGLQRIRLEADRMRDRHGGRLGDRERMRLEDQLDRLGDQVRWLRNNGERRPW